MNINLKKKSIFCEVIVVLIAVVLIGIFSTESVYAEKYDFEKRDLLVNGSDDESIVFLIMGDGFTATEQDFFHQKAAELMQYIIDEPPFDELKDKMNFYSIGVVSDESGAADDPSTPKNTYFGSCYNAAYNIQRLLVPKKSHKAHTVAKDYCPDYDMILMLVNDKRYGGSGGYIPTASIDADSFEIMLHEMGHSVGLLADEYWAGSQYAEEAPNMSANNTPATVPWGDLIDGVEIGIYPYPENPNWYHPSLNCKMQYLGKEHPFCKVCRREIKARLEDYCWQTNEVKEMPDLIKQVKIINAKSSLRVDESIPTSRLISVSYPSHFNIVNKFTSKKVNASNVEVKLSFSSNNKTIAEITKGGMIRAKKPGKATISVQAKLADGTKKIFREKIRVKK